jgi:hypothetical protein
MGRYVPCIRVKFSPSFNVLAILVIHTQDYSPFLGESMDLSSCSVPRKASRLLVTLCCMLLTVALSAAPLAAEPEKSLFPAYSDVDTAALWLFDEPAELEGKEAPPVHAWYYTQTITDAAASSQDLHRLNGSKIIDGRFGRALRVTPNAVGPGMQLPANFASEPRVYGVFLPADHEFVPRSERERASEVNFFWYTVRPDQLLSAISGDAWTIEFWLNLADNQRDEVCLIDAGQGRRTSLRLDLKGDSLRVSLPDQGIEASLPLDLPMATWTHIAIVKPSGSSELLGFIDGRQAARAHYVAEPKDAPEMSQGLVATTFSESDFRQVSGVSKVADLGAPLGECSKNASGVRLRGWIKAPYTGEVRFETGETTGLRLDVDERPLMYGWVGRAATYRRSPRWGTVKLVQDKLYPVLIEMQLAEGEPPLANQVITWSWPGQSPQPIPASAWFHNSDNLQDAKLDRGRGFDAVELMATRFNFVIGSDRQGAHAVDGAFDELRVSRVARYTGDFQPKTHSMNFGDSAPPPAQPSGPPPLDFNEDVVKLGSRKHLFFDDALIASRHGLEFTVNPPIAPQVIDPQMPGGDHTFFDNGGKVALFAPAGYEGREDFAHFWLSDDGVNFRLHDAETANQQGKKTQPIATGVPAWGRMAIDENPTCPPWAKFKFTAGVPHRGIYLLVSPDAIHWRRNETIMLQIGTGGESHWYWDDQRGEYRYLLKWDHGPGGRQSVQATSRNFFEPWPLKRQGDPKKDLATPFGFMTTCFAPDEHLGEVYRCRATKYAWAPDAYFAFIWRFDRETQARQVELAASRDGDSWMHFGRRWYMPSEFTFNGHDIHEVTSVDGLIRRDDELWQYADYSTGRHDGRAPAWRVRLKQRLDGFVSLDAKIEPGSLSTKPLTFAGERLFLNADAHRGSIKIAMLKADGSAVPGFSLADCEPVTGSGTSQAVSWRGRSLSDLAGKPMRLQVELQNAKLFALQFK